jgi:hypothetical protein
MAQVGHADESTTLRIYAKVLRRDRRHVGQAVDEMVGTGDTGGYGRSESGLESATDPVRFLAKLARELARDPVCRNGGRQC